MVCPRDIGMKMAAKYSLRGSPKVIARRDHTIDVLLTFCAAVAKGGVVAISTVRAWHVFYYCFTPLFLLLNNQ